jgi:hypothetical protein
LVHATCIDKIFASFSNGFFENQLSSNHHFLISNVVQTLKGKASATTNALEGLKVVEIIERIYNVRNEQLNVSKVN